MPEPHRKKFERIRKIDFEEVRVNNLELLNDSVEYFKDACAVFLIDKYDLEGFQVRSLLVRDVEIERIGELFYLTIAVGNTIHLRQVEIPEDYGKAFKFLKRVAEGIGAQGGWEPRLELLFSDVRFWDHEDSGDSPDSKLRQTDFYRFQKLIPNPLEQAEELMRNACATYLLDEFANTDSCDFSKRISTLKWSELRVAIDGNGSFLISINTDKRLVISSDSIKSNGIFGLALEELLENAKSRTCTCRKKKKKKKSRHSEDLGCQGPCARVFQSIENLSSHLKKLNPTLLPEDFHIFKATLASEKALGRINLRSRITRKVMKLRKKNKLMNENHEEYWEKMEMLKGKKNRLKRGLKWLKSDVNETKPKRIDELEDEIERQENSMIFDEKILEIQNELVAVKLELGKEKMEVGGMKKGIVNRLEEMKVLRKNEKLRRLLQRYPKRTFLSNLMEDVKVTAVKKVFDNAIRYAARTDTLKLKKNNFIDPRVYASLLKKARIPLRIAKMVLADGSLFWAVKEVYDSEEEFQFAPDWVEDVGDEELKEEGIQEDVEVAETIVNHYCKSYIPEPKKPQFPPFFQIWEPNIVKLKKRLPKVPRRTRREQFHDFFESQKASRRQKTIKPTNPNPAQPTCEPPLLNKVSSNKRFVEKTEDASKPELRLPVRATLDWSSLFHNKAEPIEIIDTSVDRVNGSEEPPEFVPARSSSKQHHLWETLIHQGPYFPPYRPLPADIRFIYDGKPMKLSRWAEEGAILYVRNELKKHLKKLSRKLNFFESWRECMTEEERQVIVDFMKCDFSMLTRIRRESGRQSPDDSEPFFHAYAMVDSLKNEIRNFKIQPSRISSGADGFPEGSFIKRITANDIVINCSENMVPDPPEGEEWKEVLHDRTLDFVWKLPGMKGGKERPVRWKEYVSWRKEKDPAIL